MIKDTIKTVNYESETFENESIETNLSSGAKKEGDLVKFYLNIVKRKIILIVLFGIFGFIPAWLLSKKDPVIYAGKFELLLEPVTTEEKLTDASTLTRTRGTVDESLLNLDYPTILRILKSPLLFSQIAEDINKKFPNFSKELILRNLQKDLVITRATEGKSRFDVTKIIEVSYQNSNPKLVEIILENTAKNFLEYSAKEREQSLSYGVKFIDEQIPKLQAKIQELQNKQKQIQTEYQLINPEDEGDSLFQAKIETEQDLVKTQRQLKEAQVLANNLTQDLGFSPQESLIASRLSQDLERQSLIAQIQKIETEIATQSAIFTDNYPQIKNLQKQRDNLVKILNQKNQEILSDQDITNLNPDVMNYQDPKRLNLIQTLIETQNQIDVLSTRYQSLLTLQEQINQQLAIIPDVIKQYNELEQELTLNNNLLNQLSTQKETLNVEVAQKKNPWQLISEPKIPYDENGQPVGFSPDPKKKLMAGLGGGLILGILIAILIEAKQNFFHEVSDVEYSFSAPILGKIKLNNDEFNNIENLEEKSSSFFNKILSVNQPNLSNESKIIEQKEPDFSELATNIHFKLCQNTKNFILISSLSPQDKQAFVAINFAKNISKFDGKVLLIDLNFKNPEIHTFCQKINEQVSGYSCAENQENDKIIQSVDNNQNLAMVTANNFKSQLQNSLASGETLATIYSLSDDYDLVVYNSSFFLDNYELSLFAEKTQGILMVVKIKSTSLSGLKQAIKRIKNYQLNLLGFVVIY